MILLMHATFSEFMVRRTGGSTTFQKCICPRDSNLMKVVIIIAAHQFPYLKACKLIDLTLQVSSFRYMLFTSVLPSPFMLHKLFCSEIITLVPHAWVDLAYVAGINDRILM